MGQMSLMWKCSQASPFPFCWKDLVIANLVPPSPKGEVLFLSGREAKFEGEQCDTGAWGLGGGRVKQSSCVGNRHVEVDFIKHRWRRCIWIPFNVVWQNGFSFLWFLATKLHFLKVTHIWDWTVWAPLPLILRLLDSLHIDFKPIYVSFWNFL